MIFKKLLDIKFEPIYSIVTLIWFVLLGLCGIIAVLVVPLGPETAFGLKILASGMKVFAGLILIIFWLISWYKLLELLLVFELSKRDSDH